MPADDDLKRALIDIFGIKPGEGSLPVGPLTKGIYVLEFPGSLSQQQAAAISDRLREYGPDFQFIVIGDGGRVARSDTVLCVSCHAPIVYRPDDPVIHVGCAIADDSEADQPTDPASELGRLLAERDRLIEAGVDPSDLAVPLPVEGRPEDLNDAL